MKILVTGSAGHLGEGLVRTLQKSEHEVVGVDLLDSPFTDYVGSIADPSLVVRCMGGVDAVFHTATLHKPHVATHARQEFVDTNITGTLNLLEASKETGVAAFVFTSTTSTFGRALSPEADQPAAWITEKVRPVPKNIYGVTKAAAEDLCELFHFRDQVPCLVLKTSRFFLEEDDSKLARSTYDDANMKANEYLYRRVDLEDIVSAHLQALRCAPEIGFRRYIISATTPFSRADAQELRVDAPAVVARLFPHYREEYERRGWQMFPRIDRVYDNQLAREELGWWPQYDFAAVLRRLSAGEDPRSSLAIAVGQKPYHAEEFSDGPYPVE